MNYSQKQKGLFFYETPCTTNFRLLHLTTISQFTESCKLADKFLQTSR